MLFGFVEYCKQCCSVLLSIVSYFCKKQNQTISESAISNNIDNKLNANIVEYFTTSNKIKQYKTISNNTGWFCNYCYNKHNITIRHNTKQYTTILSTILLYIAWYCFKYCLQYCMIVLLSIV